jgi:hypothetical protein
MTNFIFENNPSNNIQNEKRDIEKINPNKN